MHKISFICLVMAMGMMPSFSVADDLSAKMLPDEKWWGLSNAFGREMPFTEKTDFRCDLREENYGHQSLSFLCSDKGRAIWCAEPVEVKIAGGEIALESDKGEIILKEDAGRNLGEAYRYGSKTWFPPTGEEPELLYFSAPQYNTWIELTYHQNEKDILAYAKSMVDHGLPPGIFMIDDTWQHAYGEWYFDAARLRRVVLRHAALQRSEGNDGQASRHGLQGASLDVPVCLHGHPCLSPPYMGQESRRREWVSVEGRLSRRVAQARLWQCSFSCGDQVVERRERTPGLHSSERRRLVRRAAGAVGEGLRR